MAFDRLNIIGKIFKDQKPTVYEIPIINTRAAHCCSDGSKLR
jgi:hypothetical protein